MGGPVWEDGTVGYLEDINKNKLTAFRNYKFKTKLTNEYQKEILDKMKESIWYCIPKGDRYEVYDNLGIVEKIIGGGRNIIIKAKTLPNHILHKFL